MNSYSYKNPIMSRDLGRGSMQFDNGDRLGMQDDR